MFPVFRQRSTVFTVRQVSIIFKVAEKIKRSKDVWMWNLMILYNEKRKKKYN